MLALSLILALQRAAGAAAAPTPADSAFAHEALARGVRELPADRLWLLADRYVAQLQAWGMVDEAWRLAMVAAEGPFDAGGGLYLATDVLTELYRAGDAESARRRLDEMPPGTRDQLLGLVAERLVGTHVELAEALRDPEARNVAYLELTERAVAGGRLSAAAAFADRTADGEARVRAQLAVALAELAARRETAARDRLARTLPLLDPTWRCEGLCVIPAPEDSPSAAPRGMNRHLTLDFVLLALHVDLRDELVDWAASQPDAGSRAAAWIVLAEAMSELPLGRSVAYPVH